MNLADTAMLSVSSRLISKLKPCDGYSAFTGGGTIC